MSIVVPHGGGERLPLLTAMLAGVRQCRHVGEVIVVELGAEPRAQDVARRWADIYLFGRLAGPFERARALNLGAAVAAYPFVLWCDNDLLLPPDFLSRALGELTGRNLDYLVPHAIDYLGEEDSMEVRRGARSPWDCRPAQTMFRNPGACGLLRRDFFLRRGGFIEGFRGWGAEDLAWAYKVKLTGGFAYSRDPAQRLAHLYHADSGGYGETEEIRRIKSTPEFARNLDLLRKIKSIRDPRELEERFPPFPPGAPWAAGARVAVAAAGEAAVERARALSSLFGQAVEEVDLQGDPAARLQGADAVILVGAEALAQPLSLLLGGGPIKPSRAGRRARRRWQDPRD